LSVRKVFSTVWSFSALGILTFAVGEEAAVVAELINGAWTPCRGFFEAVNHVGLRQCGPRAAALEVWLVDFLPRPIASRKLAAPTVSEASASTVSRDKDFHGFVVSAGKMAQGCFRAPCSQRRNAAWIPERAFDRLRDVGLQARTEVHCGHFFALMEIIEAH